MINMKIIYKMIKKIVFAFTIIYSFNLIMESLNMFIPLNVLTIGIVTLLGFPGLFTLVGLILI